MTPSDDPFSSRKLTDAQTLGYSQREVAKTNAEAAKLIAGLDLAGKLGGKGMDLLIEVVRASMANPLVGAFLTIVLADVLEAKGVIRTNSALLIDSLVTASFGVGLASEAIQSFEGILPFATKNGPNVDLVSPKIQVLVLPGAGAQTSEITRALSGLLESEPKALAGT